MRESIKKVFGNLLINPNCVNTQKGEELISHPAELPDITISLEKTSE